MDRRDGVSREAIYNLNTTKSNVNAVNDAVEVNVEVLPLLHANSWVSVVLT